MKEFQYQTIDKVEGEPRFKIDEVVYVHPTEFQQKQHGLSDEYELSKVVCVVEFMQPCFRYVLKIARKIDGREISICSFEDRIQSLDDLKKEGIICNPIDLS